jgi:N-acetylglutamate synthase
LVLLAGGATGPADGQVTAMRFRLEVRLTPADIGQRVIIRWRRPAPGGGDQIADVLGILEDADAESFAVRTSSGEVLPIPAARALAGKVIPPPPARRRSTGPAAPDRGAG